MLDKPCRPSAALRRGCLAAARRPPAARIRSLLLPRRRLDFSPSPPSPDAPPMAGDQVAELFLRFSCSGALAHPHPCTGAPPRSRPRPARRASPASRSSRRRRFGTFTAPARAPRGGAAPGTPAPSPSGMKHVRAPRSNSPAKVSVTSDQHHGGGAHALPRCGGGAAGASTRGWRSVNVGGPWRCVGERKRLRQMQARDRDRRSGSRAGSRKIASAPQPAPSPASSASRSPPAAPAPSRRRGRTVNSGIVFAPATHGLAPAPRGRRASPQVQRDQPQAGKSGRMPEGRCRAWPPSDQRRHHPPDDGFPEMSMGPGCGVDCGGRSVGRECRAAGLRAIPARAVRAKPGRE